MGVLALDLYFDDEPDPEKLNELMSINLLGFLQEEVGKDAFDMGRVRTIFRALKIAKNAEAIPFLASNFSELVVFAKDMTLLMQVLETENPGCFDGLSDTIIKAILRASRVEHPAN